MQSDQANNNEDNDEDTFLLSVVLERCSSKAGVGSVDIQSKSAYPVALEAVNNSMPECDAEAKGATDAGVARPAPSTFTERLSSKKLMPGTDDVPRGADVGAFRVTPRAPPTPPSSNEPIPTTNNTASIAGVLPTPTQPQQQDSSTDASNTETKGDDVTEQRRSTYLAHAEPVVEGEDLEEAREWKRMASQLQESIDKAPRAQVVGLSTDDDDNKKMEQAPQKNNNKNSRNKNRQWLAAALVFILGMVVAVVVVVVVTKEGQGTSTQSSSSNINNSNDEIIIPTANQRRPLPPKLQQIRDRGYIICSGDPEDIERWAGWSVDMCKALAAAILGDPDKIEMPVIPFREMFPSVSNGTVDVSTRLTISSYDRDIYVVPGATDGGGVTLSSPFLYTSVNFAGIPEFVDCTERRDNLIGHCKDLAVCVIAKTRQEERVKEILDGSAVYPVDTLNNYPERLADGTCNVIFSGALKIGGALDEYDGPFTISDKVQFMDPVALATRNNDAEFGDLVQWILQALMVAETLNITQDTAHLFPTTDLFGEENSDLFQRAIRAVGNYGDMYERAWGSQLPRQTINLPYLENDNGGMFYSHPLGKIDVDPSDFGDFPPLPVPNGTLDRLSQTPELYCGIVPGRPGLAEWNTVSKEWSGLDVDYCRALAAALFAGDTSNNTLVLVELASFEDGFVALAKHELDVLAGAEFTMINDIQEPNTGLGFAFGGIYYFENTITSNNDVTHSRRGVATREGDAQWTDFVRLIVMSTIYAEDKNITQATASKMPQLGLFGLEYVRALRFAVLAVGNYAELYERNLESYIPRVNNTRNSLNNGTGSMFFVDSQF